jgi:hypothetical protein
MMQRTQSSPRLCRNDDQDQFRASVPADIDTRLDNLKRCVHWLVEEGIFIADVDLDRKHEHPVIRVAASPWLYVLLKDDLTWAGQEPTGLLMTHHWLAIRHGCSIKWDEVTA